MLTNHIKRIHEYPVLANNPHIHVASKEFKSYLLPIYTENFTNMLIITQSPTKPLQMWITVKNLNPCRTRSVFYHLHSSRTGWLVQLVGSMQQKAVKLRFSFILKIHNCIRFWFPAGKCPKH